MIEVMKGLPIVFMAVGIFAAGWVIYKFADYDTFGVSWNLIAPKVIVFGGYCIVLGIATYVLMNVLRER